MTEKDREVTSQDHWKAQWEGRLAGWNADVARASDTFKAGLEAEKLALTTCIIVNGGAAAALLALLGSLAGRSPPVITPAIMQLAPALVTFAGGVLLGMIATGVAFLAHEADGAGRKGLHRIAWTVAVLLVTGSYAAFATGAYIAYRAFMS